MVDHMTGYALGLANRFRPLMVFDWDKAAQIIRATGAKHAVMWLAGDYEYTAVYILKDSEPLMEDCDDDPGCPCFASVWAPPQLDLAEGDCWRYATPEDDTEARWPPSALAILRGDQSHGPHPDIS